jgi:hypothetical protein
MDPSKQLCLIENSFNNSNIKVDNKYTYTSKDRFPGSPRTKLNNLRSDIPQPLRLKIVDKVSNKLLNFSSIFSHPAIVLANIDAVFHFTGDNTSYLNPQDTKEFNYSILSDDSNTINSIEYLQYRLPISYGFISSPPSSDLINKKLITVKPKEKLVFETLNTVPEGLDLVIDYTEDIKTCLKLCKPGGFVIGRFPDYDINLGYLFILALSFEKISLFKPLSEDINYSYVIAENYTGSWLEDVSNVEIPYDFVLFVENYIKMVRKEDDNNDRHKYDTYKCKAIWNIF